MSIDQHYSSCKHGNVPSFKNVLSSRAASAASDGRSSREPIIMWPTQPFLIVTEPGSIAGNERGIVRPYAKRQRVNRNRDRHHANFPCASDSRQRDWNRRRNGKDAPWTFRESLHDNERENTSKIIMMQDTDRASRPTPARFPLLPLPSVLPPRRIEAKRHHVVDAAPRSRRSRSKDAEETELSRQYGTNQRSGPQSRKVVPKTISRCRHILPSSCSTAGVHAAR